MKRRKYATGTSVKGYLQSPGTALAQNQIDLADATHQAETNPFTRGLSFLGNAGMQYGIQAGGFNTIPGINGEDDEGGGGDILNNVLAMAGSYAAGGTVDPIKKGSLLNLPTPVQRDGFLSNVDQQFELAQQAPVKRAVTDIADPKVFQQSLVDLGFDPGTPDGILGKKTQSAVREFQTKNNLTPTGKLTEHDKAVFLSQLNQSEPPPTPETPETPEAPQYNFKVNVSGRTDKEGCAEYGNCEIRSVVGQEKGDQMGIYGDAWTVRDNLITRGGKSKYSIFPESKPETDDPKGYIEDLLKNSPEPTPDAFSAGDVVNLYYGPSDNFEKAYEEGGEAFSTHVGVVKTNDRGDKFIEHNIHGKVYKEPLDKFLKSKGQTRVTAVTSPDYKQENLGIMQKGKDVLKGFMGMFAEGGTVGDVPVEVEGQELGETPDGQLLQFQGPSHENGGIDVDLPEGTDIYSNRIKVNGKTMADRKAARERRRERLDKLMQSMPVGELSRNSAKRGTQNLEAEDERDMGAQNLIRQATQAMQTPTFATGGTTGNPMLPAGVMQMFNNPQFINMLKQQSGADPVQLGQNGGSNYGFDTGSYDSLAPQQPNQMAMDPAQYPGLATDSAMGRQPAAKMGAPLSPPRSFTPPRLGQDQNYYPEFNTAGYDDFAPQQPGQTQMDPAQYPGLAPDPLMGAEARMPVGGTPASRSRPNYLGNLPKMPNPTAGDAISMAGALYSGFSGIDNVRANRAGDRPNVNFFDTFGEDALQTNADTMGYVNDQTDNALYDLNLSRNSALRRGRNSARGVNTQRALDLTGTQSADRTAAGIRANDSAQMMQIMGQRSGLQNQRDQVQMQGETQRDLADREDRDNFFTQLGVAKMGKGQGIQELGKDMNAIKQRAVINNLMQYLPRYGYTIDKNGNLIETGK